MQKEKPSETDGNKAQRYLPGYEAPQRFPLFILFCILAYSSYAGYASAFFLIMGFDFAQLILELMALWQPLHIPCSMSAHFSNIDEFTLQITQAFCVQSGHCERFLQRYLRHMLTAFQMWRAISRSARDPQNTAADHDSITAGFLQHLLCILTASHIPVPHYGNGHSSHSPF